MAQRSAIPLTAEAYRTLYEAIEEDDKASYDIKLAMYLMMFSSLRVREATHAAEHWIETTHKENAETETSIKVPMEEVCYKSKDGGCHLCNRESSRHDDPELWGPKTDGRIIEGIDKPHKVPIMESFHDKCTGETVEINIPEKLDWYFKQNTYIAVSAATVNKHLKRIATDAEIHRIQHGRGTEKIAYFDHRVTDIIAHDLRASWAVQCLRSEVKEGLILDWAGWKTRKMLERYANFVDDPNGEERAKF